MDFIEQTLSHYVQCSSLHLSPYSTKLQFIFPFEIHFNFTMRYNRAEQYCISLMNLYIDMIVQDINIIITLFCSRMVNFSPLLQNHSRIVYHDSSLHYWDMIIYPYHEALTCNMFITNVMLFLNNVDRYKCHTEVVSMCTSLCVLALWFCHSV